MAVEVIGKDPNKVKQVSCSNCSSILRYLNLDVKSGRKIDWAGSGDFYNYVVCPECGQKVVVE